MALVWVTADGGAVLQTTGVNSISAINAATERQASQLLPHGPAWSRRPTSTTQGFTRAIAGSFARVDFADAQLEREIFVNTADDSLEAWEDFAGLPGECEEPPFTLEGRRDALVSKLYRSRGPLNILRFTEIATELGYVVVSRERGYLPAKCGAKCGVKMAGAAGGWQFTVRILVSPQSENDGTLNCIVQDAKHLHVFVLLGILP